jgi:hypothetical protein
MDREEQIQKIIEMATDQTMLLFDFYNLVNEEHVGSWIWRLHKEELCQRAEAAFVALGIPEYLEEQRP